MLCDDVVNKRTEVLQFDLVLVTGTDVPHRLLVFSVDCAQDGPVDPPREVKLQLRSSDLLFSEPRICDSLNGQTSLPLRTLVRGAGWRKIRLTSLTGFRR